MRSKRERKKEKKLVLESKLTNTRVNISLDYISSILYNTRRHTHPRSINPKKNNKIGRNLGVRGSVPETESLETARDFVHIDLLPAKTGGCLWKVSWFD